jgi:hypothetical protein
MKGLPDIIDLESVLIVPDDLMSKGKVRGRVKG